MKVKLKHWPNTPAAIIKLLLTGVIFLCLPLAMSGVPVWLLVSLILFPSSMYLVAFRPSLVQFNQAPILALVMFLSIWLITGFQGVDPSHTWLNSQYWLAAVVLLFAYIIHPDPGIKCQTLGLSILTSLILGLLMIFTSALNQGAVSSQSLVQAEYLSWLVVPNDGLFIIIMLPLCIVPALKLGRKRAVTALAVLTMACVMMIALLDSLVMLLVLALEILLFVWLLKPSRIWNVLLILLVSIIPFGLFTKLFHGADQAILARLGLWQLAIQQIQQQPVLGIGPQNYIYAIQTQPTALEDWHQAFNKVPWAHNIYLETIVTMGFVGLISLLWLVWTLVKASHIELAREKLNPAAVASALFGFLIAGTVELSFLRPWCVMTFAILICCLLQNSAMYKSRLH